MPNHVINEIIFSGVDSIAESQIMAAACDSDGKVDFNLLVPMPAHIWRGNVGKVHTDTFGPACIGLDWARQNWGTKWNAYSHKPIERTLDTLTLRFETAWSPPYPWLVALFNTCGGFVHNWLDEGASWSKTGLFVKDGKFGDEWKEADADEVLHRHLHKLHWGVEQFEDEDETTPESSQ